MVPMFPPAYAEVYSTALFFQIISMKIDITELIQLRELLETGIMKVIVENREEDCYRKMKSIQEELIRAIQDKNSIDQLVELDLKFHKCMAEFAGNTILEQIYNFMLDISHRIYDILM